MFSLVLQFFVGEAFHLLLVFDGDAVHLSGGGAVLIFVVHLPREQRKERQEAEQDDDFFPLRLPVGT